MTRSAAAFLWLGLGATGGLAGQRAPAGARQAVLAAEDRRAATDADRAPLFRALLDRDASMVRLAVRALGRLEDPVLVPRLSALLSDPRPLVRAEAGQALAQIASGLSKNATDSVWATIRDPLMVEAGRERDLAAAGVLARSIGRLPYRTAVEVERARALLLVATDPARAEGPLTDAARGLEALVRMQSRLAPADAATRNRLTELARRPGAPVIRRLGLSGLAVAGGVTPAVVSAGLADRDPEVRRLAIAAGSTAGEGLEPILERGLSDPVPMVRYESLRAWGRSLQPGDCQPILRAVRDSSVTVALLAIDLLGAPCPAQAKAADVLWPIVDSLARTQGGNLSSVVSWHRGAHALVSLARIEPSRARPVLRRAGSHSVWQVRMYAARAAQVAHEGEPLVLLAEDRDDNVREAAIAGLSKVRGHNADRLYIAALARPDHQLVLTAATALQGSTDPAAVPALLAALRRLSSERRDTSRDPRMAIVARLRELGSAQIAPTLEPYLADYDPEIAAAVAAVVTAWTGKDVVARPRPLGKPPFSKADVDGLSGARLRVTMAAASGGGKWEITLLPNDAPATVVRIARLVKAGYYNGLTFHRVVPNFVVQGGSPAANEYTGDSLYLRDEVGGAHDRGTMGISTRGRDTGDAQWFVNLVDNNRLDFGYTVWGVVASGMDVVDGVLEGDTIERVELVLRR
ncbi:MAG: peptidylprolyl isomerase [Gemmatimonadota bacterium]